MSEHSQNMQLLLQALQHHQAGRVSLAQELYLKVLSANPNDAEALHLLGVLKHQTGDSTQAIDLISRSVQIAPTFASLSNLGEILRSRGQLEQAVICLRRSIELKSDSPDVYGNLALALIDSGDSRQAEQCLMRAIELAPQRAEMYTRLARARLNQNDHQNALASARRGVELQPQWPEAWAVLALALSRGGNFKEAIEAARRAIALAPNHPEAHVNLGLIQGDAGDKPAALESFRKAVALNPNWSVGHRNSAAILDGLGRYEEAIAATVKALELNPNDPEAWVNLSTMRRRRMRDHPGAIAAAEQALKIRPSNPAAHGSLGLSLLSLGDYARGFKEYEWRWLCSDFTTAPREFDRPAWNGSDPTGRRIFVHHEQGLGDMIQFVRYIPMLAERGATVILEAPIALRSLMNSLAGTQRVITSGSKPPDFDLHVPLLSLPRIFGTTYETVPAEVPYLQAPADRLESWKSRLSVAKGRMRVGLIFAGNPGHADDANRSLKPALLAGLADLPDVTFVSLQKRDNPLASEPLPPGLDVLDVSHELRDFADTAAAMMHLDLTLTIDSATAHLAGALARPVWTLLPFAADWRWKDEGETTPWYPTMRLFRQPSPGDWASVVSTVHKSLMRRLPQSDDHGAR